MARAVSKLETYLASQTFPSSHRNMILGQMIQAWRGKHKVSRRELATQIGIDHVTLMRLETNNVKAISVETAGKILHWALSQEV